jgi:hypothetical protein
VRLHPAATPGERAAMAAAYDRASGKVVIFGGYDATQYLAETWTFDGTTWENVTSSVAPPGRAAGVLVYDHAEGKLVLFGGYDGTFKNDTWLFDGTTETWTEARPRTCRSR